MIAALVLVAAVAAAEGPARAVLLPVKVRSVSQEARHAGPAVDSALATALGRHASFHILSRTEIVALVGKAAESQLMGCDAEACIAEVADALGAELLVSSQLDDAGGLWNFQATLLDRRTATALQRVSIRVRTLDSLMAALDDVARKLAGVSPVSAGDPRLKERLGTDEEGLQALADEQRRAPEKTLVDAWTSVVIEHNRKPQWLAVAAAGALGGATVLMLAGLTAYGAAQGMHSLAWAFANFYLAGDVVNYPWFTLVAQWLVPLPFAFAAFAALAAGAGIVVWDALQRSRLRVDRKGCCRNEDAIEDAASPSLLRVVTPAVSAMGAALILLAPVGIFVVQFVTYFGVGIATNFVVLPNNSVGPSTPLRLLDADRVDAVGGMVTGAITLSLVASFTAALVTLTVVQLVSARSKMLDDGVSPENPAAPGTPSSTPPASAASPPAPAQ